MAVDRVAGRAQRNNSLRSLDGQWQLLRTESVGFWAGEWRGTSPSGLEPRTVVSKNKGGHADSRIRAGGRGRKEARRCFLTTVRTTDPLVMVVPAMVVRSPAWTEYEKFAVAWSSSASAMTEEAEEKSASGGGGEALASVQTDCRASSDTGERGRVSDGAERRRGRVGGCLEVVLRAALSSTQTPVTQGSA